MGRLKYVREDVNRRSAEMHYKSARKSVREDDKTQRRMSNGSDS